MYGTDELQRPAPLKVSDIKQTIMENYGCHRVTLGVYTKTSTKTLQDTVTVQAGEIVYAIVDNCYELWAQQRAEWKEQWGEEHKSCYWKVIVQIREFVRAINRERHRTGQDKGYDTDHDYLDEWRECYDQKWNDTIEAWYYNYQFAD